MSLVPARHCPLVLVLTLACASTARVSKYRYRTCIGFVEFLYEPTLDQRIQRSLNSVVVMAGKINLDIVACRNAELERAGLANPVGLLNSFQKEAFLRLFRRVFCLLRHAPLLPCFLHGPPGYCVAASMDEACYVLIY